MFYTANLKGNLALLPRLFTLIQQQRDDALVFLLDLGDTCSLDAWVCRTTQGRAPLLVLDSMGYDAAIIGGPEAVSIPVSSLRQLVDTIMMPIIIWGRVVRLAKRGVSFNIASGEAVLPEGEPGVLIDRSTQALPARNAPFPTLGDVPQGQLARVELSWPEWTVLDARIVELSAEIQPDPTIGAIVELVEAEAHHYAQQRGER
ncbi:MAG TPA: hypothetical protein VHP83_21440 [Aggregatilineaceae bacterium]|nr:hypothetical protein [Aggregatilineaceae bacterium]